MDLSGIHKLYRAIEKLPSDKLSMFKPGQIISGEIVGFHDGKAVGMFKGIPLFTHSETPLKIGQTIQAKILNIDSKQIFVEVLKEPLKDTSNNITPRSLESFSNIPSRFHNTAKAFVEQGVPLNPEKLSEADSVIKDFSLRNGAKTDNVSSAVTFLQKNNLIINDNMIQNAMAFLSQNNDDFFSMMEFKDFIVSDVIPKELLEEVMGLFEFIEQLKNKEINVNSLSNTIKNNLLNTGLSFESKFENLSESSFDEILNSDLKGKMISILRIFSAYPRVVAENSGLREIKKRAEEHLKSSEIKNLLIQKGDAVIIPVVFSENNKEHQKRLSFQKIEKKDKNIFLININGEYSKLGDIRIQFQFDKNRLFLDFWVENGEDTIIKHRDELVKLLREKLNIQSSVQVFRNKGILKKEVKQTSGINITV